MLLQVAEIVVEHTSCHKEYCEGFQEEPSRKLAAEKIVDKSNEITNHDEGCDEKREIDKPFANPKVPLRWSCFIAFTQIPTCCDIRRENYDERGNRKTNNLVHTVAIVGVI